MNGRRAVIGLSLLSALVFCAFAAPNASAAAAKNTTAFTCVKVTPGSGVFEDEHCDKAKAGGEYTHAPLTGNPTNIVVDNTTTGGATTNAVLKGEAAGAKVEITCTKVSGKGSIENKEPVAKEHKIIIVLTTEFTSCTVNKPAKCTVKAIVVKEAKGEGVEGLGAGKNEMGVEFKPAAGEIFVTINLEGAECALKATPLEIKGTAIATGGTATQTEKHSGATAIFTNAMTKETLSFGGKPAEFSATTTTRMEDVGGVKQPPISLTTVT